MKKLSTKMKRMLAILLVEVIVATNVVTSYASSADKPFTMTEEEAAGAQEEAAQEAEESKEETVSEPVEEEPVVSEPVVEEPVVQETPAPQVTEAPAAEAPVAEQPVAEQPTEAPVEGGEENTSEEAVAQETPVVSEAEEVCVCTEACSAEKYDEECPVCDALKEMTDAEAKTKYLEENCLIVIENLKQEEAQPTETPEVTEGEADDEETAEDATPEPEEEEPEEELPVTVVDNSVSVTAVCKADGEVIKEAFSVPVDGTVVLADAAPLVDGYVFGGEVLTEEGDAVSRIKKETTKEEAEDTVVETITMYYGVDGEWTELTEDLTVVYVYHAGEESDETANEEAAYFIASYVDEMGNAIPGYANETLSFEESMDLTKAPTTIENYTYIEAKVQDAVVTGLSKNTITNEEEEETVVYSYVTADGTSVEVTEETVVTFVYEAVKKQVNVTFDCVDENGEAIEGFSNIPVPMFEGELVLGNDEVAPMELADYIYKQATVDGVVVTSLMKEEGDVVTYSYVTADGESVVVTEDTVITLEFEKEKINAVVKAKIVDNFGDVIDEKYNNLDMDKLFGKKEVLLLDDVSNPPVDKVQVRQNLFKVIKYTYVDTTVNGEVIASLKREAVEDDSDEEAYVYSYASEGGEWVKIKEDTTIVFKYTDGKKSVYTYEDASVMVTATLQHANAIPDDAQFVVKPITANSSDYNYDAYMDALNAGANTKEPSYTSANTLLYDIAFLAPATDAEGNVIEDELVEYQPADGMVNISISFKKKQLENGIDATSAEDVSVIHMPLVDSVKNSVNTTAEATDISASDIKVEEVDSNVAIKGEKIDFNLSDFSVTAVVNDVAGLSATDTFESLGGEYTLEYILTNYQVVALDGDAKMNHTMGAILINGDLDNEAGFADTEDIATRVSSYISGYATHAKPGGRISAQVQLAPLYLGSSNNVEFFSYDANNPKNGFWKINNSHINLASNIDVYISDNFVNWSALASALKSQSTNLAGGCKTTVDGSSKLTLQVGDCVTIEDISAVSEINIEGDFTLAVNTIINIPDSGSVRLPRIMINGADAPVQESGSGTSIIWNLANATEVSVPNQNFKGHIIAPNAHVTAQSGNYNGGIICKSITSAAEGHTYPYNGGALVPTVNGFKAIKTIDGQTPSASEVFTFKFDKLVDGSWKNLATVNNNGSQIVFPDVKYGEESQIGEHWYIAYEEQKNVDGYSLSTILYVVKDTVTTSQNGMDVYYFVDSEYYRVNGSENSWIDPASILNGGTVDMSKISKISGENAVVFDNSTAKAEVSVKKVWNDDGNRDRVRPESVTVQLLANGTAFGDAVTLNEGNGWAYTWTKLPEKFNGNNVAYTVEEVNVPAGYKASVTADGQYSFTITNSYDSKKTQVSVAKEWDDAKDQDGERPKNIQVQLYADGSAYGEAVTLSEANKWAHTWKDLPENSNGVKINYTVEEINVKEGYTAIVKNDGANGFVIVNSYAPKKTEVTVTKAWNDADDQDGKRPASVKVQLLANGKVSGTEVTLNEGNGWTYTWTGLPLKENKTTILYTVKEVAVKEGYTSKITGDAVNGYTITNTYEPKVTEVSVSKVWDDANNQDGVRPESVQVQLYANGVAHGDAVTLSKDNDWFYKWTKLPEMNNKAAVKYTVEEINVKEGYTATVTGDAKGGYTITNSYAPEKTELSGSKTWDDADNQDGKRPTSITVKLLDDNNNVVATKIVTEADGWKWNFTGLDKYADGKEITYKVVEEITEAYTPEYAENGKDITNKYTPESTSITVKKTWVDANNQDGMRPESIQVQLFANGEKCGDEVSLTAADGWTYTWTGLDKNKAGKAITYTVEEVGTVTGYVTSETTYSNGIATITNTHDVKTVDISGSKTWNDANNQDGKRPASITINLLANGILKESKTVTANDGWKWTFANLPENENGQKITYTITEDAVKEYTSEVVGFNVINTHETEEITVTGMKIWDDANNQDGIRPTTIVVKLLANGKEVKSVTVSNDDIDANGNWAFTFTDLPKYEAGVEIKYSVTEAAVAGYTPSVSGNVKDGFVIKNSYKPGETGMNVTKVWDDANNQDGKRPGSIMVQLYAKVGNEAKRAYGNAALLSDANNWSTSWQNLPEYENGTKIEYTVEEVAGSVPTGYEVSYSLSSDKKFVTITNTYEPEKVSVSGAKTWNDANNQDGKRPASIVINLYANNTFVESKTVTAANNWAWSFNDLDKYADGVEIKYSITENAVEGYETAVNGYDVTNTHTPEKTSVSGTKTWVDNDNQDGMRPAYIRVNLLADGEVVATKTVTKEDNWSYSFDDLDKFKDQKEIVYTVSEEKVEGYTTEINGGDIVNTHTPGKTGYSVSKIWNDADNQDGLRPVSITVQLLADGVACGDAVQLNADNNWSYTWTGLDEKKSGKTIVYSVEEIGKVTGYTTTYATSGQSTVITNSHETEKVSVSGSKTWNDANNQDGKRPAKIFVSLLADGKVVLVKEVTAADNWSWNFDNLDKFAGGKEIVYTISESAVEGYTTEINGFNVTNTYEPEQIAVRGTKIWNDANNQDGVRPESITVNLLADGVLVDSVRVTADADGNWNYSFTELPKFANGKEIVYTVTENTNEIGDYSVAIDGFTITNSYTPDSTNHTVKKVWDDANNQDGVRPAEINVQLMADGKAQGTPVTLSAGNDWSYTWDGLQKYRDAGTLIVYTAVEVGEVAGYTIGDPVTANGITTITNKHNTEKVNVSGSKTWVDADNQDGIRPDSITIRLLADGTETGKTATATKANGYTWAFTGLDKFKAGKEIVYTISEDAVEGYTTVMNGFDVTNTHEPAKTSLSGSKVWNDANNQDGKRPASVTVKLLADNVDTGKSVVVKADAAGNWNYRFDDLDKFADGKEIKYTVEEVAVEDYQTEINGTVITNSYTPGKTDHSVKKVWEDANDQDGVRPESIQVQLYADNTAFGDAVTLNDANSWSYSWKDLDDMSAGQKITYTVKEVSVPEGYTLVSTVTEDNVTTITNSYAPEKISLNGNKTWNDADNQDGVRPESITIRLYANGQLKDTKIVTEADGWSWSFTGLDRFADGEEIKYTISEDAVAGYTTTVNGMNVINTHETEETSVSGVKTWADAENQDGVRPESIQIILLANGEQVDAKTVTEADGWAWSFTGLDKFADGNEIVYSITEVIENNPGYQTDINRFDVTNKYTPGETSLNVKKVWVDDGNRDGIRPKKVAVQLYTNTKPVSGQIIELSDANGWEGTFSNLPEKENGQTITYTAKEMGDIVGYVVSYDDTQSTTTITNTHKPEEIKVTGKKTWDDAENQDGKRPQSIIVNLLANGEKVASQVVSPDKDGNWSYTFEGLKKKENGTDIVYTVSEEAVAGYTATIDGTNIKNTHKPEKVSVSGTKTWVGDEENLDARPESITIRLHADGKEIDHVTVGEAQGWAWNFTDLDKYANGKEITYKVTEDFVNGYTADVQGYDVVNNYTPGFTDIEVTKVWDDNNNQDGKRPVSIEVQLYEKYIDWGLIELSLPKGEKVTLSEENGWTYKWENLPVKKQNSSEVNYSVKEIGRITGYDTNIINGADITITNSYKPELTEVSGKKVWEDNKNQDRVRPEQITVRLYDGEEEVAAKTVTAQDDWKFTFTDLPKFKNGGTLIVYTVKEDVVTGYESVITGNEKDGFVITNTHEPEKTEFEVSKEWNDNYNQDGLRPASVTVQLYANGAAVEGKTAVLNADNVWKATFENLDKYEDGKPIVYTAQEVSVPEGYEASVANSANASVITNTHVPATTEVSGSKTWNDDGNRDGVRPESITIRLYADDVEVGHKVVTEADGWKWNFDKLPKYKNGTLIIYTISEDTVKNYSKAVNNFDVTNTHEVEKTSVSGSKVWNDADNQDGVRPESITVNLHADGEVIATKEVTADADGNWSYSFEDLYKYRDNGTEIKYTVSEKQVSGYSTKVEGTTITNSYTPGKTALSVTKMWDDAENQDGKRPSEITVDLYADGVKVEGKSVTLNAGNDWSYTWDELDAKKNGRTIEYTAKEASVPAGYSVSYNTEATGNVYITNSYAPELVTVEGTKTWEDADNQDGIRPESITVRLYADGTEIKEVKVTPDADGNWNYKFTDLPKCKDKGTEIVYTVAEDTVAGYEATVEGYDITNTHDPEKVSLSGSKTWTDNNNAEGVRPESITVTLFANSEKVDEITVTPDADGNWAWMFKDLDKYADGKEIAYTISESKTVDYSASVDGYNVNNTYTPGMTQISVVKNWNDDNDRDGVRPDSITVKLMEKTAFFDQQRDEVVLSENNNWTYTWTNLPDEKKSEKVQYYVKEVKVDGYKTDITNGTTNITITNTYAPELTEISGKKVWVDNDNQDGTRPESIVVRLLADGEEVRSQEVTAKDNWKFAFTDLPKFRDHGTEIEYTVTEDAVGNYSTEITGDVKDGFVITNTDEIDKTEYKVKKVWEDAENQDGIRPSDITVQLYANDEAVEGKTVVLSDANAWKATFEDLDKYANGKLIVYTAQEVSVPESYTMEVSHNKETLLTTITNSHKTEVTDVNGSKTWNDDNDRDGVRPDSITINLLANGTKVDSKTVGEQQGWKWSFTNLPKYENGEIIEYTIEEIKVEGYESTVNGFDVTNDHEVEKTSLSGSKVWNDADNQDGIRPESITVNLHADGEIIATKEVKADADGNWTYSFEDLYKYRDNGTEIVYTVTEETVTGYSATVEGTTITNSYTPGKTTLSVTKQWKDADDQDGKRPSEIIVDLYADGVKVEGKSVTLNSANDWNYTWENLDAKKNGRTVEYTAKEASVPAEYEVSYNTEATGNVFITNTYEPKQIEVFGTKKWDDADNQDGIRPDRITVRLFADGVEIADETVSADADGNWTYKFTDLPKYRDHGTEIEYTVAEDAVAGYETNVDGYDITNTHDPEKVSLSGSKTWTDNNNAEGVRPDSITVTLFANSEKVDGITVTPDESGNWTWMFKDLDKYADGKEISYTISESKTVDYSASVEGYSVNNTYTPGTTQISVVKNWDDDDDRDGARPESITVKLMEKTTFLDKVRDEVVLSADNNWTYTWTNLPDEKKSEKVQYYVKEVEVDGYKTVITEGTTNITITNTYAPELIDISGKKVWEDNGNQDGARPESITIRLYADGEEVRSQVVTPDEKGNWTFEFTGLNKYRNHGTEIVYTVSEDAVGNYSTEITGNVEDGFVVTNTDEIDKTEYKVKKVWDDADNQDGVRPGSITVQLYANGEAVEGKLAVLNESNVWKATFEDLDKYANGKLVVYTAQEVSVPVGYSMDVTHDKETLLTTITNTHKPEEISVAGGKTWNDANNQDGARPASITINLMANGVEVAEKTVTAADDWTWSFTNLPKKENGKDIVYTITEDEVSEYTTEIDGFNATNNRTPETVEVTGTKTWDDADNQDGVRPEEITIILNADGTPAKQVTVTGEDDWTWKFTDLPKYRDGGVEIVYTISEEAVDKYTTTYDGFNVTNSYTPKETGVTVTKIWKDNDDQDGIRPEDIKVQLLADGEACGEPVTLSEDNKWTYTWTGLPEMKQGEEIEYTVEEIMAADSGYTTVITGDADTGYNIINTHDPEEIEIEGAKTWLDADNQDGIRPVMITINLFADGELVESKNVTAADEWKWTFTKLPKYRDGGVEIVYTVTENEVEGYETEVKGYDVVNTHTPEVVDVEGVKTWNDKENAEGVRPEEIIINLLADGQLIDSKTVTEADGWAWSFTNLDKFKNGVEIVYTITEEEVLDYSTTVEGYNVTNDYTPEETKITVIKLWDDAEDQDGLRPDSIMVQLYEGLLARGEAVELSEENDWTYSWEHLPAKKFGITVEYTVKEVDSVPGYTTTIVDGTTTTITNTHIPEVVEVEGEKTWDDADNQDGLRPESITVNLYADGVLKDSVKVTEADGWKWKFTDLPKNKNVNGEVSEIVYTVDEVAVEGYEAVVDEDSYDITNIHDPEVIEIEGAKTWDDADNQDGKRPGSITVRLYANGTEIDSRTVTEADGWKWSFTELPKFAKGVEIVYTITEDVVAEYTTTYDGYNITNSYTPEKTSRRVVKVWDDQDNKDGLRPVSIEVQLYADGKPHGKKVTLSAANGWKHTWKKLDRMKAGKEIAYTVVEITKIGGYTTSYSEDTFTITNKHTPTPPPTPTPTPPAPTPTPVGPTPTPTPETEVLGATRVEDGTVLGARRGTDYAVLGKRRRPATGDSIELLVWLMALSASIGSAVTSVIMLGNNKKKRK